METMTEDVCIYRREEIWVDMYLIDSRYPTDMFFYRKENRSYIIRSSASFAHYLNKEDSVSDRSYMAPLCKSRGLT